MKNQPKTKSIVEQTAKLLSKTKKTIAIAESCTGGLISKLITDIPGSSNYFLGGIVAYSNDFKINLLGVKEETIKKYGAVSIEVAKSMAQNIKKISNSNIGIGVTGIAGPTGQTKLKSKGLVFIAIDFEGEIICKKFIFRGVNRNQVRINSSFAALEMLRKKLC